VQRGDRRAAQITTVEFVSRWSSQTVSAGVVSAHWLENESEPTIVLY
jgi:hypothetical protein